MSKIKRGSVVTKKNEKNGILFKVKEIIRKQDKEIAILKGIVVRIIEVIPIEELKLAKKGEIKTCERNVENKLSKKFIKTSILKRNTNSLEYKIRTGRILHLDGDKRYTEKSYKHYRKLGLDAIVRYVPENRQPYVIKTILNKYNPDILVITGHDGMIKKGTNYNDIYNYRNSKYFINTVQIAREWDVNNKLVIFAGACQSYFEALISAGANFASSPSRVLIDFADPLIVAEKIATTDNKYYVTINDIASELRDGKDGIGGIGANGKKVQILQ